MRSSATDDLSAGEVSPRKHYLCLDGLRGVAILLVVGFHLALRYPDIYDTGPVMQVAQFFWLGVDLFFVLSGFLITEILLETKKSRHYFRNFLARRFLRIWPLYYLSLAIFFIVAPALQTPLPGELQDMQARQNWFWMYAVNWLIAKEGSFGTTPGGYYWSLAVEEQFYLIWPFLVYWLSERRLLQVCVAVAILSLALRLVLANYGVSTSAMYTMTVTHSDGLIAGAVIALCLRSPDRRELLVRGLPFAGIVALTGLVVVRLSDPDGFFWSRSMAVYGYSFAALLFGVVCCYALISDPDSWLHRLLSGKTLRLFGRFSYALYLVHVPIIVLMHKILMQRMLTGIDFRVAFLVFVLSSLALSLTISAFSWHLVEKHILKLKVHFA